MLALFALTRSALALSCLWGVHDANVRDLAEVPPNVEILLSHTYGGTQPVALDLLDADGNVVPTAIVDDFSFATMVPDAPLAPGDYLIEGDEGTFPFTVAGPDDTTPPDAVDGWVETERSVSEWGKTQGYHVTVDALPPGHTLEVQVASDPGFADARSALVHYTEGFVGASVCTDTIEGFDAKRDRHVRFRVVDLAGNVSDWTEATVQRGPLGCDVVGGGAAGLWLLGLGLVGLRRGRARRG